MISEKTVSRFLRPILFENLKNYTDEKILEFEKSIIQCIVHNEKIKTDIILSLETKTKILDSIYKPEKKELISGIDIEKRFFKIVK